MNGPNQDRSDQRRETRQDLDWLIKRLRELPLSNSSERAAVVKQVGAGLERTTLQGLEEFIPTIERLIAQEPSGDARMELRRLSRALRSATPALDASFLAKLKLDELKECIADLDAYAVYKPRRFDGLGLPKSFLARVTRWHADVDNMDDGVGASGISTLDFLVHLADRLGVDSWTKFLGRGRQVEVLRERLLKALGQEEQQEGQTV